MPLDQCLARGQSADSKYHVELAGKSFDHVAGVGDSGAVVAGATVGSGEAFAVVVDSDAR